MSNTRAGNVQRVDTTSSTFADIRNITAIRYIGASSGTANIVEVSSGNKLWEESGASNSTAMELDIRSPSGITVNVTNSAVVYLYYD